ncbi:MAG: hypothetical protein HZB47_01100 [Nitrosomonadales bacterium]|nr:hypothetical protein [Nitrosomonadales bacterium]
MNSILSQVSYPVFIACVFVFFIIASVFSFIVGVGLATRNARMLRVFNFMNTRISTRQLMKPFAAPHFIEPELLKRPMVLGSAIVFGAGLSVLMLWDVDDIVFLPIYAGAFSKETTEILADYTHSFLLIGNGICVALGGLILFRPEKLAAIGRYTDRWLTFRKQTKPLNETYFDMDKWVMSNATVAGITLSVLSLGLGVFMYMRL